VIRQDDGLELAYATAHGFNLAEEVADCAIDLVKAIKDGFHRVGVLVESLA